jgi:hypothetical protein
MRKKREKKPFIPPSPTYGEALRFIENEAERQLRNIGQMKGTPHVSISLGCPVYFIQPYLYSRELHQRIAEIFRKVGIAVTWNGVGQCYLGPKEIDGFIALHRSEILTFAGKGPEDDDEPGESSGGLRRHHEEEVKV